MPPFIEREKNKNIHVFLYLHKETLENTQKVMKVAIFGEGVGTGWMKDGMEVRLFTVHLFFELFEPQE